MSADLPKVYNRRGKKREARYVPINQWKKTAFSTQLWAAWLSEHNERMGNPAVALKERQ